MNKYILIFSTIFTNFPMIITAKNWLAMLH